MKKIRKPLKVLLVTNAMILISAAMLWPIYALFVEDIGGDLLDASFAGWLFALTAGIVTVISWRYADKIKHESLILVLWYAIMSIWFFWYIFVDSIMMLFIVQIIIWLWEAIYSPVFDSLYGKHIHKKQRWFEWGLWESTHYFTLAWWAFIWWLLVNYFGFNSMFILMWILSLFSALYILFFWKKIL